MLPYCSDRLETDTLQRVPSESLGALVADALSGETPAGLQPAPPVPAESPAQLRGEIHFRAVHPANDLTTHRCWAGPGWRLIWAAVAVGLEESLCWREKQDCLVG